MKPYASLTLRGRARRLRRLAKTALGEYELDVQRIRLITNSWNCVFRVDATQGRFVIRVSLPGHGHSPATVRSEASFLAALAFDSQIEVPSPLPARDGRLAVSAGAPGVPEERMCVVYSWVMGKDLAESITPETYAKHGALHARLHDFATSWTPPESFTINDYTCVFHFPGEIKLWEAELLGYEGLFREALAASDELINAVRERDPVIITHGDLHQYNVKLHRGVLRPIDFEDVMWATCGLDVGTTLYYVSRRDDYTALRDAFRAGYESVAPWIEGEPGEIDRLRFPRALDLLNIYCSEPEFRVKDWPALVERMAALARVAVN